MPEKAEGQTSYDTPKKITTGGTYSGSWQSTNAVVPAVKVATRAPVVLEDCDLRSRGNLIEATVSRANVTVRDCRMSGLHPGASGSYHGYAFYSDDGIGRLRFEHNYVERTCGVLTRRWTHGTPGEEYKVRYNEFVDIDGRKTNSTTGYSSTEYSTVCRMSGLGSVHDVPGLEIAWNTMTNHHGRSAVEDAINFFGSGGSSTAPYLVHDNLLDGMWGPEPTINYSGGGILTDGGSNVTNADNVSQWIHAYNNVVLDSIHYGVKVSQGHHNKYWNNVAIRDGKMDDGTVYMSETVQLANTGSGLVMLNAKNQPDDIYNSNMLHDSKAGWYDTRVRGEQRNFRSRVCYTCTWANNTAPYLDLLTDEERAVRDEFAQRIASAGVTLGLMDSTPTPL